MKTEARWKKALRYLGRALILSCPVCGKSPIFPPLHCTRTLRDWFTPLDGCPRCGYPYEREPGYFLVSVWIINYGAGSVLGIMIYVIREFFYHPPICQLILSVIVPISLLRSTTTTIPMKRIPARTGATSPSRRNLRAARRHPTNLFPNQSPNRHCIDHTPGISSNPADHCVMKELRIVVTRVVERVMETATLLAADGAVDDERGGCGEVPEFK